MALASASRMASGRCGRPSSEGQPAQLSRLATPGLITGAPAILGAVIGATVYQLGIAFMFATGLLVAT